MRHAIYIICLIVNSTQLFPQDAPENYPYLLKAITEDETNSDTKYYFDDFDGDGFIELVDSHSNITLNQRIHYHGYQYPLVAWQKNYFNNSILSISSYHNKITDSHEFVTFVNKNGTIYLDRLSLTGDSLHRMQLFSLPNRNPMGKWDGNIRVIGVSDLNHDGSDELIGSISAGYSLQPRGFFAIDMIDNKLLWFFRVGTVPGRSKAAFYFNNHETYIVVSTQAPDNGQSYNGFDDSHSYMIILDKSGNLVWSRQMAGAFSSISLKLYDIDNDGIFEIITSTSVLSAENNNSLQESSDINALITWRFDVNGKKLIELNKYTSYKPLSNSFEVSDINADGNVEFIIAEKGTGVIVLNENLNIINEYKMGGYLYITLVSDLDFDTKKEIVVSRGKNGIFVLSNNLIPLAYSDGVSKLKSISVKKTAHSKYQKSGMDLIGIGSDNFYRFSFEPNSKYNLAGSNNNFSLIILGSLIGLAIAYFVLTKRKKPRIKSNLIDVNILTPREKEICLLIADGLTSKKIALLLHISFKTVEKHRENILMKLGCNNSAILVKRLYESGILASKFNQVSSVGE